jgi:hypothetical protein
MPVKRSSVVIFLLLWGLVIPAIAQPNSGTSCSNQSAKGRYGYSCSGVAANPFNNFSIQPFAAYGVVTGDGEGQWNGQGKVSFNGTIVPWTHKTRMDDPAQVNPDCTGSVTYEVTVGGGPVPDAHFEFVIVDDGREIKGFPIDPGYAVSCQLILQQQQKK